MTSKTISIILIIIGVLALIVGLAADYIGLGKDPGVFGWKQMTVAGVGLVITLIGVVMAFRGSKKT
ncbi:MAG: hypothetical protein AB1345_11095 [Chloroflexota bacterium]